MTVRRPGRRAFTYRYAEIVRRFESSAGMAVVIYQAWRGKTTTLFEREIERTVDA